MATLLESLPYRRWILGVGLDSDENGNPPSKFASVFARAKAEGYLLTMHCDVDIPGSIEHIAHRDQGDRGGAHRPRHQHCRGSELVEADRRTRHRLDLLPDLEHLGVGRLEGCADQQPGREGVR